MVTICKICDEGDKGRLLVNGRPLCTGVVTELYHGNRVVFGWAFCFRLVISGRPASEERGGASFEAISREVLEYSMTSTEMGMMRATAHWQGELLRRNVPEADTGRILEIVGEISAQLEEANALCGEVLDSVPTAVPVELDLGLCFSYMSSRPPNVVVQVWKRGEGRLLSVWPAADFDRRMTSLRDVHREAMTRQGSDRWALRLSREEWWGGEAGGKEPSASAAPSDTEEAAADHSSRLGSAELEF